MIAVNSWQSEAARFTSVDDYDDEDERKPAVMFSGSFRLAHNETKGSTMTFRQTSGLLNSKDALRKRDLGFAWLYFLLMRQNMIRGRYRWNGSWTN
jgi:hypothetical protein